MLDRLAAAIDRHCPGTTSDTKVPRLSLISVGEPVEPSGQLYEPMVCFVAAGAKRTTAGDLSLVAPAGEMLLTTIDLPVDVSLETVPYRSAVLHLHGPSIADLIVEMDGTAPVGAPATAGHLKAPMTPELLDAVTRWVELLDAPGDIRLLAPGTRARSSTGSWAVPWGPSCASGPWSTPPRAGSGTSPGGSASTTRSRSVST
ncbi:AraC family transcriptional regulator [Streptomyces chiangmaiensis]